MKKMTKLAAAAAVGLWVGGGTANATPVPAEAKHFAQSTAPIVLIQDRDRGARGDRGRRGGRDWDRGRRGGFNLYIGPGGAGLYRGRPGLSRCQWLRNRAISTGSNYWWRRYRQCRGWR